MKYFCENCKTEEIPEPIFCCNHPTCGCMGRPIDPPLCEKCYDKYFLERK
jgi:hypothetical protein